MIETSDQHRTANLANSAVLKMLEEQEGERMSGYKRVAWPPESDGTPVKGSTPQPQQQPKYQGGQNYYSQPTQPQYPQQYGGQSPQPQQQHQQPAQYYQQHQYRQEPNSYQQPSPSHPERSYQQPDSYPQQESYGRQSNPSQERPQQPQGFRPIGQSSTVSFAGGVAQKHVPSLPGQPQYPPVEDESFGRSHFVTLPQTIDQPQYGDQPQYSPQPQYSSQPQPQYSSQAQPQYNSQPQTQYGSQAQPQYGPQAQSQYGSQAKPQYGSQAQPQYGSQPQPQYGSQAQPQPQYGSQPQYTSQAQPQYSPQPQPQYNAQPQPQYSSQPQYTSQPQYSPQPEPPYLVSPSGQQAEPIGSNPAKGWSHVRSPTLTRSGYTQGSPQYPSSTTQPSFGSQSQFGQNQPQNQQFNQIPVSHQPSYGQQHPQQQQQQQYSPPQQQYYSQGGQPQQQQQQQFDRGQSPGIIQLRKEAPVSQKPAPVVTSQPAAKKFKGGSNMRGDLKWPPPEVKAQMEAEVRQQRELSLGPAVRPRRVHKDYTKFFAKHALNSTYPGYKVPPGTQHMYAEF